MTTTAVAATVPPKKPVRVPLKRNGWTENMRGMGDLTASEKQKAITVMLARRRASANWNEIPHHILKRLLRLEQNIDSALEEADETGDDVTMKPEDLDWLKAHRPSWLNDKEVRNIGELIVLEAIWRRGGSRG